MDVFDSELGVAEWFSVLNWECLPDFGPCHSYAATGQVEKFLKRYVINKELERFCGTILEKLKSNRAGQPMVVLEGDPGVGKTTLIYLSLIHI